jgi:hypothetical protein
VGTGCSVAASGELSSTWASNRFFWQWATPVTVGCFAIRNAWSQGAEEYPS